MGPKFREIKLQKFRTKLLPGASHVVRCAVAEDLQLDELSWLLGVLLGAEPAGLLLDALVEFVEAGVEESWYDAQLRRRYEAQLKRGISQLV